MGGRTRIGLVAVLALAAGALGGCHDEASDGESALEFSAPAAPVAVIGAGGIKAFRFSWEAVAGAREYRLIEDPDGASGYAEVASIEGDAEAYEHVVFLPARIDARYILQACNDHGCTDSAPMHIEGSLAGAVGHLKAPRSEAFGYSVALSADGATLAVGAIQENGGTSGTDGAPGEAAAIFSGAVYVFDRAGDTWQQQARLEAANAGAFDRFGWSVALSDDGNTLAVGAPFEDGGTAPGQGGDPAGGLAADSGAAYVFVRDGGVWNQHAYIKASNAQAGHGFGWGVALDGPGDTLAVGAPQESSVTGPDPGPPFGSGSGGTGSGAAYVFVRDGAAWREQARLKGAGTQALDSFGWSIALDRAGATLAVGAAQESNTPFGVMMSSGAVYIFARADDADGWTEQAYIKPSDPVAFGRFGWSVALSADGDTLAAGAIQETAGTITINGVPGEQVPAEGAVYVFARDGASAWREQAALKADNGEIDDHFGYSLALDGHGDLLAIGAPFEDGDARGIGGDGLGNALPDSGAAYLFEREPAGGWRQSAYIKAANPEMSVQFGHGVALARDTLAVGAVWEMGVAPTDGDAAPGDPPALGGGAVYLY